MDQVAAWVGGAVEVFVVNQLGGFGIAALGGGDLGDLAFRIVLVGGDDAGGVGDGLWLVIGEIRVGDEGFVNAVPVLTFTAVRSSPVTAPGTVPEGLYS